MLINQHQSKLHETKRNETKQNQTKPKTPPRPPRRGAWGGAPGGRPPRDAGAQGVFFYGYYLNNGSVEVVPNGNYQLQLRVLKPLGKASTSSHWETYTSPKFYIIG